MSPEVFELHKKLENERSNHASQRAETQQQRELVSALDLQLKTQQVTIEKLQHQLNMMIRRLYGKKSEKLDVNQLLMEGLTLEGDGEACPPEKPEAPVAPVKSRGKTKAHGRRPIPDHLPRKEIIIDVSDEEKRCPITGGERPLIGYEESEKLEYRPETLQVNVYKRAKYGSPVGGEENGVLTAPLPPMLIERCLADSGMLAHIAVSKFDDHLPLCRLEKMLSRQGVLVSRKTMAGWLAALAQGLQPLAQLTKQLILKSGVTHHDDTPVKMLDPGMGKTKETRLWVAASGCGPPLIHFAFSTSREQKHPIDFFNGYQGAVMCDEYAGYGNIDCETLLSCWAHARRYLENAKQLEPVFIAEGLLLIGRLYSVEKESKDLSAPERQRLRQEKSQPLLETLFKHLESKTFRPGSPVTKAQGYILGHRKGLSGYIKDGHFPIDNNVAERAIRRVAIGRKNWLFLGSENGGESAATLMTLLGSCWANQINTFAYLKDVIERLPTHPKDRLEELLAPQWIVAHPEHLLPKQN